MTSSVYTYVGNADSKNGTGAIATVAGHVEVGQSGLFLPIEYQECLGEGLLLTAGPAKSPWKDLTAPTVAVGSSGTPNGTYRCCVTFVTAAGETVRGPEAIVVVSSQQIAWSNIPVAPDLDGVIARNLYRTSPGGAAGTEKLVVTITDNTTTTYTDNVADGLLGASLPTTDTSFVVTPVTVQPSPNTPVDLPLATLDARYAIKPIGTSDLPSSVAFDRS